VSRIEIPKRRLRRSMLYIPGNNPAMLQNGGVYGADSVLLDLEDAVSIHQKDAARALVRNALMFVDFGDIEVTVRINPLTSPFGRADLEEIVPLRPDAIRVPKIESPEQIVEVERIVAEIEARAGVKEPIRIHPMIETALGVESAFMIARASKRIDAITMGGQDLTADMGVAKTKRGGELNYARERLVMAAKACKIGVLDTVFADVNDTDGLIAETRMVKELGFDGKAVINPRQIEPVHSVFAPTADEISLAKKIVAAMEEAERKGLGVISVDGNMIDAPVVARATKILELAKQYTY
jgi:citrate lyase subunit beta / citryl-CoA lyase